jgi:replication factor A1
VVSLKISDLKEGNSGVSVTGEIVGIEAPRQLDKNGRQLRVANATLSDESGTISLVLWNESIDKVKEGSKVQIEGGFVNSWQGKAQLTLGRMGRMTVLE